MHKRSKHSNTKLHFIRERIENREVKIQYVPTEEMTADTHKVITSSERGKTQNVTLRRLRTL